MSKATLTFDLNDPDDFEQATRCMKSLDMACVLFEIESNLKKRIQYKLDANPQINANGCLQLVFEEIAYIFEEHNINVEELIT